MSLFPASGQGQGQDAAFPSKSIRIVVASSPGALTDFAARLYADRMTAFLKQSVVVENIAGGGTLLASRQVLKTPPDGYTLLVVANTIVTVPHLNAGAGYALKDFVGVGELARSPSLLVTSAASPYKSLADLVAAAKKDPGKISYGSGGMGTTNHLPVELLAKQAGIKLLHVPYKGIAVVVPDVIGGRVDFMMGTTTSTGEMIRKGTLRPLAITSESRSPKFPDVPTFKELGYAEASYEIWIGVLAPAGLPPQVKAKLSQALEAARADPELRARLEEAGQSMSGVKTPEAFDAVLRKEDGKFGLLIKEAGLSAAN